MIATKAGTSTETVREVAALVGVGVIGVGVVVTGTVGAGVVVVVGNVLAFEIHVALSLLQEKAVSETFRRVATVVLFIPVHMVLKMEQQGFLVISLAAILPDTSPVEASTTGQSAATLHLSIKLNLITEQKPPSLQKLGFTPVPAG